MNTSGQISTVNLLVVASPGRFRHHVPAGFIFADEVFAEAKLKDSISEAQNPVAGLERALAYLSYHYPRRIRVRWIDLWSLSGLLTAARYKLRHFPAVIVNGQQVLAEEQLEFHAFRDMIGQLLSQAAVIHQT